MNLYNDFLLWQDKLQALVEEGKELGRRMADLEEQNASLQKKLLSGEGDTPGFAALSSLYDEGYHICPAQFGHLREEDCLFCLNFLHHKGRKV